jgi:hypothetical protein
MAPVLQPWQIVVAALAGWLGRQQDAVIEYLCEENRVLKQQLGRRRLRLTDDQRRVIRLLNERLQDSSFILMGPGRWGTRDMRKGIHVGYADINFARMLIEIARPVGGFAPEVSFGSHFFQDLIESRIRYLALYPDEKDNLFDERFLHGSPNALPRILPNADRCRRCSRGRAAQRGYGRRHPGGPRYSLAGAQGSS